MSVTVIIPARYASTRLPGKPLLAETGKPLIQHVVENVQGAQAVHRIVVATDDKRIADAVHGFNAKAVMTREDHTSGTDRLAEAAEILGLADDDIVVNVQGDEPEIPAGNIDILVELLEDSGAPMATLCTPLDANAADDPNNVKVVFDKQTPSRALYFSRAKIPYNRDEADNETAGDSGYYLHLGIYAYRVRFLEQFAQMPSTDYESREKLEQLRVLEDGYAIAIQAVEYNGSGIDTPEDYAKFVERMKQ